MLVGEAAAADLALEQAKVVGGVGAEEAVGRETHSMHKTSLCTWTCYTRRN